MTNMERPSLRELMFVLGSVTVDWYDLGIQLDIDSGKLAVIRENNHHAIQGCMRDMLEKWQQMYPNAGWHELFEALKRIDRNDVAQFVYHKYIDSTPSPPAQVTVAQACTVVTTEVPKNVVKKLEKIEDEFYQLISKIKEKLRLRLDQKDIARLASFCSGILQIKHFHCSNMDDLFSHLQSHLHFLNYNLLERIDRTYLSRATKPDIKRYKTALNKFTKSTTIAQFKSAIEQLHPSSSHDANSTTIQLQVKDTWQKCTVYNIDHLIKYLFPYCRDSVKLVGIHHSVLTIVCTAPESAILCLITSASKRLPVIKATAIDIISIQIGPLLMMIQDEDLMQVHEVNFEERLFMIIIDQPHAYDQYTLGSIRLLVFLGADINAQVGINNRLMTLLVWSIVAHEKYTRTGTLDRKNVGISIGIVDLLLQLGADPNHRIVIDPNLYARIDPLQRSNNPALLHRSCTLKHIEIAKLLLQYGADVNSTDNCGQTALLVCATIGNTDIAELLLQHGAVVDVKDEKESTALWRSCLYGYVDIVKLLLDYGADPNTQDIDGITPLLTNCGGDIAIFKMLLQHGADPNVIALKVTALSEAIIADCLDVVNELLQYGADPNLCVPLKGHSLCFAATNNNIEIAKALLKNGGDVNKQDRDDGRTPLMFAAWHGNQEIIKLFLAHGAHVTTSDVRGDTALSCAIANGQIEAAKILIPQTLQELASTPQPPPQQPQFPFSNTMDTRAGSSIHGDTMSFSDRVDSLKTKIVFPTLETLEYIK